MTVGEQRYMERVPNTLSDIERRLSVVENELHELNKNLENITELLKLMIETK